jgi:AbrB family looped-hinge helix DNA binding protein
MAGDIIFRFLGKDGKITIPYAIRESLDLQHGDILSFEELDDDRILITRESLCVCNARTPIEEKKETLLDFLNRLSPEQKAAALVHLSMQVAGGQKGSSENA